MLCRSCNAPISVAAQASSYCASELSLPQGFRPQPSHTTVHKKSTAVTFPIPSSRPPHRPNLCAGVTARNRAEESAHHHLPQPAVPPIPLSETHARASAVALAHRKATAITLPIPRSHPLRCPKPMRGGLPSHPCRGIRRSRRCPACLATPVTVRNPCGDQPPALVHRNPPVNGLEGDCQTSGVCFRFIRRSNINCRTVIVSWPPRAFQFEFSYSQK